MLPIAATLDPALWKPSAASRRVMDALSDVDATEPQILFVGGIVRNAVLGLAPGDADMATVYAPEEVTRRLDAEGIKVVPTGIAHGTITAVADGEPFEITTLRRDVETDGRHAVVSFTSDWNEDAQRRDFTMNTLLADTDGRVYDPTGQGLADLRARRVVFVGDPAQRIDEDYLRILRFFRFHALYGQGEPDKVALVACRNAADKIATLSKERITQEVLKIVAVDNPADILGIMRDNSILPHLFHFRYQEAVLKALVKMQNYLGLSSIESRLIILCSGEQSHLDTLKKYLLFSKTQRNNLESLFKAFSIESSVQEQLYRFGRDIGVQSVLIKAAVNKAEIDPATIETILDWPIPVLPVSGNDLKELGVDQGPRLGEIMKSVEARWIKEGFPPDRAQCLDWARACI